MSRVTCQTIQSALDLLMLGERSSSEALAHLTECVGCRDFQAKQTKLREIVGSLGTVSAPADFDFRLRARLANERPGGVPLRTSWLFGPRALAAGSALAVIFAVALFVGYRSKPGPHVADGPKAPESVAVIPATPSPEKQPIEKQNEDKSVESGIQKPAGSSDVTVKSIRSPRINRRSLSALDFSSTQAVVEGSKAPEAIFAVEASQQSYRVSLFDGRGKERTISVPPVSFGSQRAIPTSNQFAPKGIW